MTALELLRAELSASQRMTAALERAIHEIEAASGSAPAPVPASSPVRRGKAKTATGKVCKGCGEMRPRESFLSEPRNRDGLGARCRPCIKQGARERYAAKRDKDDAPKPAREAAEPSPAKPAGWVDPAERIKLIRERAARGAS